MKNTFAIAVDLDETLAGTFGKIFEFGREKHDWKIPFEQVIEHDWWNVPGLGISKIQAFSLFDDYCTMDPTDATIPQIPGARAGLLELIRMGADPYVVTARTESVRGYATEAWLATHMPEIHYASRVRFTNHYLESGGQSKGEVCQSIGADILIDDNVDFLHSATAYGIHGILLEKPWNRTKKVTGKITRVGNWEEIPSVVSWIRKHNH